MPPDPLVLAFDTAAAHCAAVLVSGDRVLARTRDEMAKGQAERLIPMLEGLLAEAGAGWRDLNGLGVGVGPGNFTGLRIAVAAARGLALALDRPAVGISGFDALARAAGAGPPIAAAIPGPQGQLYVQAAGAEPRLEDPSAPGFWDRVGKDARAVGAWPDPPDNRPVLRPAPRDLLDALGLLAAERLAMGAAPTRPVPLYIKPPDAAPPPGLPGLSAPLA